MLNMLNDGKMIMNITREHTILVQGPNLALVNLLNASVFLDKQVEIPITSYY